MKNPPKVRTGDRVRVVLEGVVRDQIQDSFYVGGNLGAEVVPGSVSVVSVEVLPPPVEVFGPGDTVRNKAYPERAYTLTAEGHWDHFFARFYPNQRFNFTSRYYERVHARFFEVGK